MDRTDATKAGVALGIGGAALLVAGLIIADRAPPVDRPEATGDVGVLAAYGQLESGPIRLLPTRRTILPRPQHLAFQFTAEGTGPRIARVELLTRGRRIVMHEERLEAPKEAWSLGSIITLDDTYPDELELVVVVEAPHARTVSSQIKLRLVGGSKTERTFGP